MLIRRLFPSYPPSIWNLNRMQRVMSVISTSGPLNVAPPIGFCSVTLIVLWSTFIPEHKLQKIIFKSMFLIALAYMIERLTYPWARSIKKSCTRGPQSSLEGAARGLDWGSRGHDSWCYRAQGYVNHIHVHFLEIPIRTFIHSHMWLKSINSMTYS